MVMSKFKVIRGARIIAQLEEILAEDSTYGELERRTLSFQPASQKRQWAVDPIQITKMELDAARESGNLQVNAIAQSDSGKQYQPQMLFSNVIYEDTDQPDNISFKASTGDTFHIIPISLNTQNVQVRCTCLDFYWRFAKQNHAQQSLLGKPPPLYQKRTQTHAPANPTNTPGLCKHLMKVAIALKEAGIVKPF